MDEPSPDPALIVPRGTYGPDFIGPLPKGKRYYYIKRKIALAHVSRTYAGRPPGPHGPSGPKKRIAITMRTPEDTEHLIDNVANAVITGKMTDIKISPQLSDMSFRDREMLTRVAKVSVEEFNARLAEKLGALGDQIADKIKEKLDKDLFKTNELSFAMVAALQQRANLDGRNALANANIAIQVNNFSAGGKTREEMIAALNPENIIAAARPVEEPTPGES